jgi:hypothetical protein
MEGKLTVERVEFFDLIVSTFFSEGCLHTGTAPHVTSQEKGGRF